MNNEQPAYARLPGKKLFLLGSRSLWLGQDHLLWVQGNMFQEQYKRFYYKDIQALMLRRNYRRMLWTIAWLTAALLSGALGALLTSMGGSFFAFAAVCAPFLIVNILAGPGCDVFLKTAVHLEKISSLTREKVAVKALDHIRSLAEQSQGALNEQFMPRHVAAFEDKDSHPASRPGHLTAEAVTQSSAAHWMLVGLSLLLGLSAVLQYPYRWISLEALLLAGWIGLLVLAIMVLVREPRSPTSAFKPVVVWPALIFALLRGIFAYIYFFVAALQHPETAYNTAVTLKYSLALQLLEHPWTNALNAGFAAAALWVGMTGTLALLAQPHSGERGDSS